MRRPQRALITHWFNPPHIVPLVEVVPGEKTGAEAVQATQDLLEQVGKSPVQLKKEVPGFLVNRIQIAMLREILDLLDRGVADPEEIDRAVKSSIGFRLAAIGPLEVIDFAGLDVTASVFKNLVTEIRSDRQLPGASGAGGPVGPFWSQERRGNLPLHPGDGAKEGVRARPPLPGPAAAAAPGTGNPDGEGLRRGPPPAVGSGACWAASVSCG